MDSSWMRFIGGYLLRMMLLITLVLQSVTPLYGQCFAGSLESIGELYESTGDEDLDNMLYHYKTKMEKLFGVKTYMYICEDSKSPNAYAFRCNDFSECRHGYIIFGYNMLLKQLWESDYKEYSVVGVLAHEFAHILQYAENEDLPTKLLELHADFLAGYYLGKQGFLEEQMEVFARSLFEMGDFDFWHPDHHGTPQERVQAMITGFMAGKHNLSVDEAYREGVEWVVRTQKYSDFVTCSRCKGTGIVLYDKKCDFCLGSGVVVCGNCRGQGGYWANGPYGYNYYPCGKCRGNKRLWCSECGGDGFWEDFGRKCEMCNGEGRLRRR